jgi:hypothetical protein
MLWRVFFPAFTVLHLFATWWLMGIWFEVDGVSLLDPVVHAWCCFTHLSNVIVGGVVNFISDNLYFYFSLRHNLEFHIPFALGSVSWSALLTCIIIVVRTKLMKPKTERHPNQ